MIILHSQIWSLSEFNSVGYTRMISGLGVGFMIILHDIFLLQVQTAALEIFV